MTEPRLTSRLPATTMPAMDRTLLEKILQTSPGLNKTERGYEAQDDHRASIYLGQGGSATVIGDLVRIMLHERHVEVEQKDRTLHFVPYEPVLVISLRRPREELSRTGF